MAQQGVVLDQDQVTCDLCTRPGMERALKSCLVCVLSYCQTHLQPHYHPKMKNHKLVEATSGLQERICSSHEKLLEIFCRTDQQCICMLCTMDEHKGHDTVSVKSERKEKQDKLVLSQQEVQQREWSNISTTVSTVDVFLPPEPKTRADLLRYSCQLTLNPNTAYTDLSLSEENRQVKVVNQHHPYPDHPERFTRFRQVLCREALSGRCYWEVEWRDEDVEIAVSYKYISRTDSYSGFGNNNMSWSLRCSSDGYMFRHNSVNTAVSGPQSSRVGVYLDHEAGTLSFYSVVSDTVTLLRRVQTTFTQTLYTGFLLWSGIHGYSAEIMKLW